MRGGLLLLLLMVGAAMLLPAATAQAQWPAYSTGSTDPHFIDRGPPGPDTGGWYLSSFKLFLYFLIFLFWVRSADWVNRDLLAMGDRTGMNYQLWNALVALPFVPVFLLFGLTLPFLLGLPLLFISYFAPFFAYVVQRNAQVRDDERVFMPRNVSDWF